jgi:hypothetical protein
MGTRNVKNLQAYKLPKRSERWLHQFIAEASADVTAVSWNVNWNCKRSPSPPMIFRVAILEQFYASQIRYREESLLPVKQTIWESKAVHYLFPQHQCLLY